MASCSLPPGKASAPGLLHRETQPDTPSTSPSQGLKAWGEARTHPGEAELSLCSESTLTQNITQRAAFPLLCSGNRALLPTLLKLLDCLAPVLLLMESWCKTALLMSHSVAALPFPEFSCLKLGGCFAALHPT